MDEDEMNIGPCVACLYEDLLDRDSLCGTCGQRFSEETRKVVLDLLKPPVPIETN